MRTRALYFLSILLGSASYIYSETCPQKEDLHPCTCREYDNEIAVQCSDEKLTLGNLKRSLNALSGKENVNLLLDSLKLGTVPSNFFYGTAIKRLEISRCELDSLSDDGRPPLLGLETTLKELSIVTSFTEENVPAKLKTGHLVHLKKLEISHNVITELDDEWFERGPASLEYLTIFDNGIEKVGNRAFANLVNLVELSFDGNRFGPLKRSILPNPSARLETLELNNNALTYIPEDMFSNMPALTTVSFQTNGISGLHQRTWQPIWQQLEVIYFQENPIECDSYMNWLFTLRRTTAIYGTCQFPREFEGQRLQDFIDSRSRSKQIS